MGISSHMTRRRMLRMAGGLGVSAAGVAALAACGEAEPQVITKEVPVETTVIKEVPVETIVTRTEVKEVPVERIVTQEKIVTQQVEVPVERVVTEIVERERVVEKVVTREVEVMVEAPMQKTPVRLEFSTDWGSGVRAATHQFMAEQYNKVNPHVTVDILIISGSGGSTAVGYSGILTNLLVAGSGPELMSELWWNADLYNLDLEPHMERAGLTKNDFWWHDGYLVDKDGVTRGVPYGVYVGAMMANLSLVERFGVTIPDKDYSFDELRDLAAQMRDPETNVWGFERQTYSWNQGFAERFASEGAEWYDTETETSTASIATQPGGNSVEAFADWWKLAWEDGVSPNTDEVQATLESPANTSGSNNLFASGLIGMSGFGYNSGGGIKNNIGGRFDFHVFWPYQSPYSGLRGYHNETNNIVVNRAAEERGNAEEAAGLAFFWHGDIMAPYLAEFQPVVPAVKNIWNSPFITEFASGTDNFPDLAAEAEAVGQFRENWVRGTHSHPNWLEWFRLSRAKLTDRALVGGENPYQMMEELDAEGTEALRREI